MADVRYAKGLPDGMRAGAEMVLGKKAVNERGEHYADTERPSFSYGQGRSKYASRGSKRSHGTITI